MDARRANTAKPKPKAKRSKKQRIAEPMTNVQRARQCAALFAKLAKRIGLS